MKSTLSVTDSDCTYNEAKRTAPYTAYSSTIMHINTYSNALAKGSRRQHRHHKYPSPFVCVFPPIRRSKTMLYAKMMWDHKRTQTATSALYCMPNSAITDQARLNWGGGNLEAYHLKTGLFRMSSFIFWKTMVWKSQSA